MNLLNNTVCAELWAVVVVMVW